MESNTALFDTARAWAALDPDATTRAQLEALIDARDEGQLGPMFNGRIAFGTAGLRAIMGPGPKAMNRLVVRQSCAGIWQVLTQQRPDAASQGVVVAYDGRLLSHEMALDAAGVLCALGAQVHLFDRAVPTPLAGFASKRLRTALAVVITASHNPKAYNGLKIFWHDAAQIVPPLDSTIAKAIDAVALQDRAELRHLPCWDMAQMRASGRLHMLGDATLTAYIEAVDGISRHKPEVTREQLNIAYTPLHGVGAEVAEAALARAGFTAVHTVPEQRAPDGTFPTAPNPNPEEPHSMDAVLDLAEATHSALACANDPDADRLAIAARTPEGALVPLTGDELGLLLADDALRAHGRSAGPKGVVGTTLVSSRALKRLAAHYGAHYFETLTGFKWLAQQAREAQEAGQKFLCAYEEALGYALGDVVWDKDGISALLGTAKLAAALMARQQTLWHRLEEIARIVGVLVSAQATIALDPKAASALMGALRAQPPVRVGDFDVVDVADLKDRSTNRLGLPQADVMVFEVRQRDNSEPALTHARIIVRPSGTEPKVKCYYDMLAHLPPEADWGRTRAATLVKLRALMQAHATLLQKN